MGRFKYFHFYGMFIPHNEKMISNKKTLLYPFIHAPWKSFTFKEIKRLARNTSDNYVHSSLKKLCLLNILVSVKVGNVIVYSLNDSLAGLSMAGFLCEFEALNDERVPLNAVNRVLGKIDAVFYSCLVTGSYVRGDYTSSSDLDVVFICDDKRNPKSLLSQISQEAELSTPSIHAFVFSESQFLDMLSSREENFGKEVAKNFLVIVGGFQFMRILMEAKKNGFVG